MTAIECAIKAGRNREAREGYMSKARVAQVIEDRRFYVGLARDRHKVALMWLRLAKERT